MSFTENMINRITGLTSVTISRGTPSKERPAYQLKTNNRFFLIFPTLKRLEKYPPKG
jgi:hypothetical protein